MKAEPFFSTSGAFIGYRTDNYLSSPRGIRIGQFFDNEVYDKHGKYRGEIFMTRLARNLHKERKIKSGFTPTRNQPLPRLPRRNPIPVFPSFRHFYPEQ